MHRPFEQKEAPMSNGSACTLFSSASGHKSVKSPKRLGGSQCSAGEQLGAPGSVQAPIHHRQLQISTDEHVIIIGLIDAYK